MSPGDADCKERREAQEKYKAGQSQHSASLQLLTLLSQRGKWEPNSKMMGVKLAATFILLLPIALASPVADAAPDAEASPEAEADADA